MGGRFVIQYRLAVRRPFDPPEDPPGGEAAWFMIDAAARAGVLDRAAARAWERRCDVAEAVELMRAAGFDSLRYRNLFEDPGSASWAIFHPGQAWRRFDDTPSGLGHRRRVFSDSAVPSPPFPVGTSEHTERETR